MNARVTVIKKCLHMDVIKTHLPESVPIATACMEFQEGQTFEIRGAAPTPPDGFCTLAWKAVERSVERACRGEKLMWANAFPCCPDGLRPVTFRVESVADS